MNGPEPARRRPHEVLQPALAADTDPRAERVQIDILRRMPAAEKMALVAGAIQTSRTLALAGLRRRFPTASADELHRRLMDLLLGEELAARVYGPRPGDAQVRPAP